MNSRYVSVARALLHSSAVLTVALALTNCGGGDGPTAPPATVATVQITGAPAENALLVGGTAQLTATPRDAGGVTLSRTVTWNSDNVAVATVSPTGLVTAVSGGSATISATADAVTSTVAFTVRVPIPVPPAGTGTPVTTTALGGAVVLTVPPAATATTTQLTVVPAATAPTDTRALVGTTYTFGPAGTVFSTPITMELRFNPLSVPAEKRADLRINLVGPSGTLSEVPGGSVDLVNNRVVAPVSHFSTYTVVMQADPTQIAVSAGNNQSAQFGTSVATRPAVLVRDAQNRPVRLADVKFEPAQGSGAIRLPGGDVTASVVVETDTLGIARLSGDWILGNQPGTNTLTASVLGTTLSAQFTAQATAPPTQLVITAQPTTATSGLVLPSNITVEIRNQFGGVVTTATNTVAAVLVSGNGQLTGTVGRAAVNGVATFNDLRIGGNGPQRIRFVVDGLTPDTTDAINVTQTVAGLALIAAPTSASSNVVFATQPVVELRDHAGLRVVAATQPVVATIVNGTGGLYGNTSVSAVDGTATFTDLGIEGSGPHIIAFNSAGAQQVTTPSFQVAALPPGIRLKVGDIPTSFVTAASSVVIPLRLDLSQRDGANVASVSVTVSWDPARFSFVSEAAGAWSDDAQGAASITVNTADVANGTLRIAGFTNNATTQSFILRSLTLQALPTATVVSSPVTATVTAAGNAAGSAIAITPRPLTVTVTPVVP